MPNKCSVLVADDNRDAADSLVSLLQALGHRAFAAYDGAQACDAFVRLHFDVAILDVQMPIMDGCAAAVCMRAGPHPPKRIASMTGMRRDFEPMRSSGGVFDEHLAKPCGLLELDRFLVRAELACSDLR